MYLKFRPRVCLLTPYMDEGILDGVVQFALQNQWILDSSVRRKWHVPMDWTGDGIITSGGSGDPELDAFFEKNAKKPIVFIDTDHEKFSGQVVAQNSTPIGKMVVDHFIEQGYKKVAFISWSRDPYTQKREQSIRIAAKKSGCSYRHYAFGQRLLQRIELPKNFVRDIKNSKSPIGILCANDEVGALLLRACERHGISVPSSVGVVGVDNDALDTRLSALQMSSVDNDRRYHGFQAARVLHELINKRTPPTEWCSVEPKRVVVRESSSRRGQLPDNLEKAISIIKQQYKNNKFHIQDLEHELNISRRRLQELFKQYLGLLPSQYLKERRLDRVCQRLQYSEDKLYRIAVDSGFSSPAYLSKVFQAEYGMRPMDYRRSHQGLDD